MKKLVKIDLPEELDKAMSEELDALVEKYRAQSVYHPELVDLGLPSGRLWADKNIGANAPEDHGDMMDHYDACVYIYANGLKTPSREDFDELDEHCEHEWTEVNGVKGMKFTSKENGNSVFFPASGYRYGTSLNGRGSRGFYWSSSLLSSAYGYDLDFYSGGVDPADDSSRFYGFSVRAVQ